MMSEDIPAKRQKLWNEELEGLQNNLLRYNLSENTKLTLGPFFQKENPDLDAFYVPPSLSKVLPIRLASLDSSYRKESITSLEQLLNPLDKRKRFTCITSNAGLGKTSFCKFLARLWCAVKKKDNNLLEEFQRKADYLQDVEYLSKFNYLFSVNLKDVECNNINIEDIVFSHLRNKIDDTWDNENNKRILQKDLKEKHSLIILDGLDEIHMSKITPPLESRKYTIICTSRSWKLGELGMSTSTYTEIQLEEMNSESIHKLLRHANICLNSQSVIKRDIGDFFTVLKEQNLESLLPNPLIALQLLCIYHDRYDINTTGPKHILLGKTRTHVYANVVDMMLKLAKDKEPECFEALIKNSQDIYALPPGFDEAGTCKCIQSFVLSLGKLAFHDIIRQSETEMPESFVCQYLDDKLKQTEKRFLLASGLISGSASNRFSEKSMVYTFLHRTYQEMLACVYISTMPLNSENWDRFESYFKANVSPGMMSFLCVMNYEQGQRCSEMYSSLERDFYRGGEYHENELISYQNAVLMAHKEYINSGTPKANVVLKHMVIDRRNNYGPPCSLIAHNIHRINTLHLISSETGKDLDVEFRENKLESLRLLLIAGNNDTLMLETLTGPSSGNLRFLFINDVELKQQQVDLTGCKHLSNVELENVVFSSVQVEADNFEQFWMYFKNEFIQKMHPIELRLKGKFSTKLKALSVMHVKLNMPIDLSECVNLQKLVLGKIISSADNNAKCFQTFAHFTHLELLLLDSLQYPDSVTLDFSGLKHLKRLRIINVKVDTAVIAADELSELWVYYSIPIANTIKPLILTVPASSNFTNNLEHLSLIHVDLNGHFDLSQSIKLKQMIVRNVSTERGMTILDFLENCNELEQLRIEALNSHEHTVLDMTHMTNLKNVYIDVRTLNVQIENIPTENLEIFWTYTSEPKQLISQPQGLHLPAHAQFTRSICELSLENVHMNQADFSSCENLSKLRVDEMSQSVLETVCPHAVKELYLVNISTDRMGMLFKAKEWSKLSKLSFERCEQHVISPILKDASTLQTLQLVRFKNTRVENIVDQFIEINTHQMEFENMSLPGATLISIANQFSKRSKAMKFNVRNSNILSTNIEEVFDKLNSVCINMKNTSQKIKDRRIEKSSYLIEHLYFETSH